MLALELSLSICRLGSFTRWTLALISLSQLEKLSKQDSPPPSTFFYLSHLHSIMAFEDREQPKTLCLFDVDGTLTVARSVR